MCPTTSSKISKFFLAEPVRELSKKGKTKTMQRPYANIFPNTGRGSKRRRAVSLSSSYRLSGGSRGGVGGVAGFGGLSLNKKNEMAMAAAAVSDPMPPRPVPVDSSTMEAITAVSISAFDKYKNILNGKWYLLNLTRADGGGKVVRPSVDSCAARSFRSSSAPSARLTQACSLSLLMDDFGSLDLKRSTHWGPSKGWSTFCASVERMLSYPNDEEMLLGTVDTRRNLRLLLGNFFRVDKTLDSPTFSSSSGLTSGFSGRTRGMTKEEYSQVMISRGVMSPLVVNKDGVAEAAEKADSRSEPKDRKFRSLLLDDVNRGHREHLEESVAKWRPPKEVKREQIRLQLQKKKREEEEKAAEAAAASILKPLSPADSAKVDAYLNHGGPLSEVVAKIEADSITRENMQTLRSGCWLSDEVIHFYFTVMKKRDEKLKAKCELPRLPARHTVCEINCFCRGAANTVFFFFAFPTDPLGTCAQLAAYEATFSSLSSSRSFLTPAITTRM